MMQAAVDDPPRAASRPGWQRVPKLDSREHPSFRGNKGFKGTSNYRAPKNESLEGETNSQILGTLASAKMVARYEG